MGGCFTQRVDVSIAQYFDPKSGSLRRQCKNNFGSARRGTGLLPKARRQYNVNGFAKTVRCPSAAAGQSPLLAGSGSAALRWEAVCQPLPALDNNFDELSDFAS